MSALLAYFQIEIIPFLTLTILLYLTARDLKAFANTRRFQVLLVLVLLILFIDGINWLMILEPHSYPPALLWGAGIMYCLLSEIIGYTWFSYVYYRIHGFTLAGKQKYVLRLLMVPLFAVCIMILSAPWNHLVFYIGEDMTYHRGSLHLWQMGLGAFYMVLSLILSRREAKKAVLQEQKREYLFLGNVVFLPLLGGVIQALNYDLVVLWPFSSAALFLLFCDFQERQISIDSLTGLNNRGNLERFLQRKIQEEKEGWYFVMIDMDGFKNINDTYGHMEGDHALRIMSQTLKQVFGNTDAFLSRFGGDEFAVVWEAGSEEALKKLFHRCRENLEREAILERAFYKIEFSVGYIKYEKDKITSTFSLIQAADRKMYKNKKTVRNTGGNAGIVEK